MSSATWAIFSFVIVYWICQTADLESTTWTVVSLWVLSGLVVLWPKTDALLTKVLVDCRLPTMAEQQRLTPAWSAATQRAGVYGPRYTLWIEDSRSATASRTVGDTVAVTQWALYTVPPSHLEAVLVRELMARLGGRTWLSRLGFWYSIPARLIAVGIRSLIKLSRSFPAVGWTILCFLLVSYLGLILLAVIFFKDPVGPLLYLTPFAAPLIALALRRWSERLADRAAADSGYGARLIEVLYGWQNQQRNAAARATPGGSTGHAPGGSSTSERIRALEIYQQGR